MAASVQQSLNLGPSFVTGAVAATSTASTAVATGAEIDATQFRTVCYTITVATHDVDWSVFGANVSDYSDEVAVLAAVKVASAGVSSYTVSPAPFRFYRVKIIDDVGGTHGVATINGVGKA